MFRERLCRRGQTIWRGSKGQEKKAGKVQRSRQNGDVRRNHGQGKPKKKIEGGQGSEKIRSQGREPHCCGCPQKKKEGWEKQGKKKLAEKENSKDEKKKWLGLARNGSVPRQKKKKGGRGKMKKI